MSDQNDCGCWRALNALKFALVLLPIVYVAASGPLQDRRARMIADDTEEADWRWQRPWNVVFRPLAKASNAMWIGAPLKAYWGLFVENPQPLPTAFYLREDVQFSSPRSELESENQPEAQKGSDADSAERE